MGALAALLLDKGCEVSGSDLRANDVTRRLRERGADIFTGHDRQNIKGAGCVVFSSAISADNPELTEARKRQIPVLPRARLLAQLMDGHVGITVAGAHGKTTTTSMIAHLLEKAGLQPTTAVGGIVNGTGAHAGVGRGEYFVAEVDESDGSFLYFSPRYSVITNIDFEHIDYYHGWRGILDAYRAFIGRTEDGGIVLACGDDARLFGLLKESRRPFKTYGFSSHNDIYASNIAFDHFESRFDCIAGERNFGQVLLKVPGRHNVANALACISLGLGLSVDFDVICESLKEYGGVRRRFQLKGSVDDIRVIDDYAHHPTEIKATLETARLFKRSLPTFPAGAQKGRLIVVFQPHRYSRVRGLLQEFAESLAHSDHLIVTDIYAAGEKPLTGVTAEKLCERARAVANTPVRYLPKEGIVDYLLRTAKPADIVMTLGAGDITRIADDFVEALRQGQGSSGKGQGIKTTSVL